MEKFRDLKKKLLAGLCAFASGVGGASALNDTNVNQDSLILSNSINDSKRSVVDLDLDKEGVDLLNLFDRGIDWSDGVVLCGFSKNGDLRSKNRDFALVMKGGMHWFGFEIVGEAYGGAIDAVVDKGTLSILNIKVELNYIVRKLRQKGYKFDKANSKIWKGTKDLGAPPGNLGGLNETIKADLADIVISDVMGSNYHIDSDTPEKAGNSWIKFIKGCLVPKIDNASIESIQVDQAPANNQLMTRFSDAAAAGCNDENVEVVVYPNFKADRVGIFKRLFTDSNDFKRSDYYKTIKRAPYPSGNTIGHKFAVAGDIIFGGSTIVGGGAAYLLWLKNQRDKASYEEEFREWDKERGVLKAQAGKFEKAKKMAQAKRSQAALSILDAVEKGNGYNKRKAKGNLLDRKRRRG